MEKYVLIYALNNKLHLRQFNDSSDLCNFVVNNNIENYLTSRFSVNNDTVKELQSIKVLNWLPIDVDKLFFL